MTHEKKRWDIQYLSSDDAIFELLRELRADLVPVTRRSHASSMAKLLAILQFLLYDPW